tara:strand:+ start:1325 stop:1870 length:546 start_codon:yes stop_codon:yes gene_type:complete
MKTFQEFFSEAIEQQTQTSYGSGSTPQSGTQGGSIAPFRERPRLGLGSKDNKKKNRKATPKEKQNIAKNAGQEVKNAGQNTAGSTQSRKPQPYRYRSSKPADKSSSKGGAITKVSKPQPTAKKPATASFRPQLGTAQRPDLMKGKKESPQLGSSPERKSLSSSPVRTTLNAAPQRKALPGR